MCKARRAKPRNRKTSNSENEKNENHKSESKWHQKWIYYAAIVITILVILVFSINMYFSREEPYHPRLHYVIRQYIDIANQQVEMENQMLSHLMGDPLGEIIKIGLRPIQERVASLRTQTSQYEKMERIPGGPTSFITSSLKELDHIINNQMSALYAKVFLILSDVAKGSLAITKTSAELIELGSQRLDIESIREMVVEDVTLVTTPMEPDMQKRVAELARNTTLEETVDKLNKFADLYERLEEIELKLSKKAQELFGLEDMRYLSDMDMSDEDYEQLLPLWDEFEKQRAVIEKEKFKLQTVFTIFALFTDRIQNNLKEMSEKLIAFAEQQRFSYIRLQEMVLTDAQRLKVRIQNLQYKYAKRRSEL